MYTYKCKVIKIVDADTFDCLIDLGFHIKIVKRVRLLNYDAPETFRPKTEQERELGLKAKQWCERNVLDNEYTITTLLDKTDKYGRCLGTLQRIDDGIFFDVVNELKSLGFVK